MLFHLDIITYPCPCPNAGSVNPSALGDAAELLHFQICIKDRYLAYFP